MGRYVYCNGEMVWKYVFSIQPSEQGRIYEEFGIGEYESCPRRPAADLGYNTEEIQQGIKEGWIAQDGTIEMQGDILTLTPNDIPRLKQILDSVRYEELKAEYEQLEKLYEGCTVLGIRVGSPYDKAIRRFAYEKDFYFYAMIDAYIRFMEEHPDETVFVFEGEY